jgi:hypothetical protein
MKRLLTSFLLLVLLIPPTVLAQGTEEFTIRVFGGIDDEPPTTPTLLTATPVTENQIDITWSASTDNFMVSGYVVSRDGIAIATTSLLGYSDTGLVASTTYSYAVQAFDPSFNYSSSSNTLATTTLQPPPPPPVPEVEIPTVRQQTATRVVMKDLQVNTGVSTTSLQLDTAYPARIEVRWGRSASYELGYVVSNVFSREHAILITDLEPGTTYEYEIVGFTPFGRETILKTGTFTTESLEIPTLPTNVSRFSAVTQGQDVALSWQIPTDANIAHVRIVRSHLGFPEYPQDGAIAYQGLRVTYTDVGILSRYSPVYYTAFVYDVHGNVSSGAIAIAYATPSVGEGGSGTGVPVLDPPRVTPEATSTVVTDRVTVDMRLPDPADIRITQQSVEYTLEQAPITVDGTKQFVVSIPRTAVAGNLKTIIVTVLDPTNHRNSYSYLLRINKERSAYEAVVPALGVVGSSQIRVSIYDYEAFIVAQYEAPLILDSGVVEGQVEVVFPDALYNNTKLVSAGVFTLVLLTLVLFLMWRRRTEDNH